jgi:hypothetical protein
MNPPMTVPGQSSQPDTRTSIDKALDVCEALSQSQTGLTLTDLARLVGQPRPSVHRLLAVLRRRGFVRQDEDTQRYSLTLKMLDLSFRLLGRSELRLHAYPLLRGHALHASNARSFVAVPASDEVTYTWSSGPDEVAMRTVFGRQMPAHCSAYFGDTSGSRRLSCLRLPRLSCGANEMPAVLRLGGADTEPGQRLLCSCAPVFDYTGREVARVGVFGHGADETPAMGGHRQGADDLGRAVSMRLGFLPQAGPDRV